MPLLASGWPDQPRTVASYTSSSASGDVSRLMFSRFAPESESCAAAMISGTSQSGRYASWISRRAVQIRSRRVRTARSDRACAFHAPAKLAPALTAQST